MKKEVMEIWVKALRSGEFGQTKERLKDDVGHCCLGVLCTLAPKEVGEFRGQAFHFKIENDDYSDECPDSPDNQPLVDIKEEGELPSTVQEWSGMYGSVGEFKGKMKGHTSLAELNDGGKTFLEIADLIENNWQNL